MSSKEDYLLFRYAIIFNVIQKGSIIIAIHFIYGQISPY